MRARQRGVTLIELMIVVIVIAILASIAVPSYRSYILRSHRSDATAELLRVRTNQEKFFLQNNAFSAAIAPACPADPGSAPRTENGYYVLCVDLPDPDAVSPFSFRVTAAAIGGQLDDQECRSFAINDRGQRSAEDAGGADTTARCWR